MNRLAFVAIITFAAAGAARARDCESMSGPVRTDCFIGRARIQGQQSEIAAGTARRRADAAYLRAVTGTSVAPKPRHAKPRHRVPPP